MASPTSLSFRHIFGMNSAVSGNGSYLDEESVCYVAGKLSSSAIFRNKFIFGRL
jgi:hypothetical protein